MILLYAVTAGAAYWWWWAYKKRETLNKYEFENRTPGGVVEFKNYDDAKKHSNLKGRLEAQMKIAGFITVVLGLLSMFVHKF